MDENCVEYEWKCVKNTIALFLKPFHAGKSRFFILVTFFTIVFVIVSLHDIKRKRTDEQTGKRLLKLLMTS